MEFDKKLFHAVEEQDEVHKFTQSVIEIGPLWGIFLETCRHDLWESLWDTSVSRCSSPRKLWENIELFHLYYGRSC